MDNKTFIQDLMQEFQLTKDVDLWWHEPSKKYIIRHHTLQHIFDKKGLVFPAPDAAETWAGAGYHQHLQRCFSRAGVELAWAYGEANERTCGIHYYAVMAGYRGIALAGKAALGWSNMLYSEHEADWDRPKQAPRQTPSEPRRAPQGGGRPQGPSRFPPAPWATVEDARASIAAGEPPAFDKATMAKFPMKSGKHQGKSWLQAAMDEWHRDGNCDYLEKLIAGSTRDWQDEGTGYSDFMKKRLHTLMWIRTRVDLNTGEEKPEEEWEIPAGWARAGMTNKDPDWM